MFASKVFLLHFPISSVLVMVIIMIRIALEGEKKKKENPSATVHAKWTNQ